MGCLGKRPMLRHEGLWLGSPQQRDSVRVQPDSTLALLVVCILSMNVFSQRAPTSTSRFCAVRRLRVDGNVQVQDAATCLCRHSRVESHRVDDQGSVSMFKCSFPVRPFNSGLSCSTNS